MGSKPEVWYLEVKYIHQSPGYVLDDKGEIRAWSSKQEVREWAKENVTGRLTQWWDPVKQEE